MKTINNNKCITVVLLIIFSLNFTWSQTYSEDEESESTEASTTVNGQEFSQSDFSSFFNTTPNVVLETIQSNSISIQQVGSTNNVSARVASRASEININQNGLNNNVNLTYQVDAVVATLGQNGNDNTILDYVIDPNAKVSLDLQQNGNNLTFDKFGTNEITKNIKFTQTEASPTIIIRSFN
ncbi:hypothetical protein [Lacinutrix sp. Bg11-31]|uniref:hypothetical protein n=1 Tax=Lacinutrix sp. Bg11-31 TaxID=2057808 RepID=UPI000C308673|nr:hypothetical protein [Lacinutrix sp. Bg11-31]AUC82226.1 hypothetical protein CW733_08835 [Lacinutrix sp. Bg11-31]